MINSLQQQQQQKGKNPQIKQYAPQISSGLDKTRLLVFMQILQCPNVSISYVI